MHLFLCEPRCCVLCPCPCPCPCPGSCPWCSISSALAPPRCGCLQRQMELICLLRHLSWLCPCSCSCLSQVWPRLRGFLPCPCWAPGCFAGPCLWQPPRLLPRLLHPPPYVLSSIPPWPQSSSHHGHAWDYGCVRTIQLTFRTTNRVEQVGRTCKESMQHLRSQSPRLLQSALRSFSSCLGTMSALMAALERASEHESEALAALESAS